MPDAPAALVAWLRSRYPQPQIDSEWLNLCYTWVLEDSNLNPATEMAAIQTAVQTQYLSSNLSDSTVPRTGFPEKLEEQVNHVVKGPILVEITAMDDIGVSAFTLNKTRLVREERMAAGELEQGDGDEEIEGEGPIPKYPRSTLSLRISDGTYALKALEYKPLPELVLGSTPLGCKLLLKNVTFMRGTALLSRECLTIEGHETEEREANRERDFARGLRVRLGIPEPEGAEEQGGQEQAQADPAPPPIVNPAPPQSTSRVVHRSPSPDIMITDPPPIQNRGARQTVQSQALPTPASSSSIASSSPFFPGPSKQSTAASTQLSRALNLSPARPSSNAMAVDIIDSDDEFDLDDDFDPDDLAAFEEADRKLAETGSGGEGRTTAPEILTLSDDSEKENVSRPSGQIRRNNSARPRQMSVDDEEIITISDSD